MFHLLYVSNATKSFSTEDLKKLLGVCRKNNSEKNVTGMLLYKKNDFMQALEGDEEIVRSLYLKISKDLRHKNVVTLLENETDEREFYRWSMAFRNLDDPEIVLNPSYSEFLNLSLTSVDFSSDKTRCQRLFSLFKNQS